MSGTYLAVKPTALAISDIKKIQKAIGLVKPIPKEKLHCTLMYSEHATGKGYVPNPDIVYSAQVIGCKILGEPDSKWRAIVLELKCPELNRRFNFASSRGLKHSYPNFLPHVSLAYQEGNGDLEGFLMELKSYLAKQPQLTIDLTNEYSEPLTPNAD